MVEIRLAEILAALSLATDLADGVPLETGLRGCLIAVGIATEMGISGETLSDVYYTALLSLLGCTSVAHAETAPPISEELKLRGAMAGVDPSRPAEVIGAALNRLGRDAGPLGRAQAISSVFVKVAREGPGFGKRLSAACCEVGGLLAAGLGLRSGVVEGRYSGLLETTQLVLGGLNAGNWVCVSMNFPPLAVLAPEDQRDPKRYRGWRLTTDRCLRMLPADNVTQIGTNAGSADV